MFYLEEIQNECVYKLLDLIGEFSRVAIYISIWKMINHISILNNKCLVR